MNILNEWTLRLLNNRLVNVVVVVGDSDVILCDGMGVMLFSLFLFCNPLKNCSGVTAVKSFGKLSTEKLTQKRNNKIKKQSVMFVYQGRPPSDVKSPGVHGGSWVLVLQKQHHVSKCHNRTKQEHVVNKNNTGPIFW